MESIDWEKMTEHNVPVVNDTSDLYRNFDCTAEAEVLYERVKQTVNHDLPQEIEFLRCH